MPQTISRGLFLLLLAGFITGGTSVIWLEEDAPLALQRDVPPANPSASQTEVGQASTPTPIDGSRTLALAQQNEQVRQYRAKTIVLFKELMQRKRQEVIVFSVFESGAGGRECGMDNPPAHDWLQQVRRHVTGVTPQGVTCWEADQPLGLFLSVCDRELLYFGDAGADAFNALALRFWLLTICTEHPQACGP